MVDRRPLVLVGGVPAELPASDALAGSAPDVRTWPVLVVSRNSYVNISPLPAFVTMPLDLVAIDTHAGWDGSFWTCPVGQDGLYLINSLVRYIDDIPAGIGWGQGAGTSNGDGPSFTWTTTIQANGPQRNTWLNSRVMSLVAGDRVRLFTANGFSGGRQAAGQLIIMRMR